MIDIQTTEARLRKHLKILAVEIGERSVRLPASLKRTAEYISGFYEGIGVEARLENYNYQGFEVANVVAEVRSSPNREKRILTRSLFESFLKNPHLPAIKLTVPFNGWIMPAVRLSDHASLLRLSCIQ